ncbi:MAG TPA: FAD:protein FMN transferase [Vicinamibacterales bacterium]
MISPPAPRPRRAFWRTPGRRPAALARLSVRAMACRFEVALPVERLDRRVAVQAALQEATRLDERWSVFRPDSLLAAVNRQAHERPVPVDAELAALLALCTRLHEDTGGAFDITTTPLSRAWRLLERAGEVPEPEALSQARACVGMAHVELGRSGDAGPTVRFRRPGVELNLGAIGKGYAVDRIAVRLRAAGATPALVSAAGSSIAAAGAPPDGWLIALRGGPETPRLRLRAGAVGTTGTAEQGFTAGGVRYGHVLDPRTGEPARGMTRVTVVADTAAEADALSTAFFIGGPDLAARVIARHPHTLAILQPDGSAVPRIMGDHPGVTLEATCT